MAPERQIRFELDQLYFHSKGFLFFKSSILCPLTPEQKRIHPSGLQKLASSSLTLSHFPQDYLIDFSKLKVSDILQPCSKS